MSRPKSKPAGRTGSVGVSAAVAFLAAAGGLAATAGTAGAQVALENRDTVVFLGNGVTQQHQFSWMVECFLRLRYPELDVRFVNAGHVGDTCEKALGRLKEDVLCHKPTVAVVCFGLYEGGFQPFDRAAYERFKDHLRKLLDALQSAGVRVVLCSPTPVDADRQWQGRDLKGYNEVMAKYADFSRREAEARKLTYADVFGPLTAMQKQARAAKPAWSVFDHKIPVLLNSGGHLCVASTLLSSLAANTHPVRVTGEFKDGRIEFRDARRDKPEQTGFSPTAGATLKLREPRRPVALAQLPIIGAAGEAKRQKEQPKPSPSPAPQGQPQPPSPNPAAPDNEEAADRFSPEAAARAAALLPAVQAMNELHLRIGGLPKGDYHIRLDGRPLGSHSAEELAKGVNLVNSASAAAKAILDDDLERIWNGVALKDALLLRLGDPKLPAADRERAGKELDEVNRGLAAFNREMSEPMRLAILPGVRIADPKAGPAAASLRPGQTVRHLVGERYYDLYLPKAYDPADPGPGRPLLVWLHPDRSAPEPFEAFFRELAEKTGVIVALPCAWTADWQGRTDCGFLADTVIRPLTAAAKADPARVFVAGHGGGAAMACELAAAPAAAGLVKGVVAISAPWRRRPVAAAASASAAAPPLYIIHGDNDPAEPVAAAAAVEEACRKAGRTVALRRHDKENRIPPGAVEDALKFLLDKSRGN
jgi:poly(3-hydroxybutyrate) depolymerase